MLKIQEDSRCIYSSFKFSKNAFNSLGFLKDLTFHSLVLLFTSSTSSVNSFLIIVLLRFRNFIGFGVLELFLNNLSKEIHLWKLSKEQEINLGSAKTPCNLFKKENILNKKQVNLKLFQLNNENYFSKEFKKTYRQYI